MDSGRYRTSSHLQILEAGDVAVVANGFLLQRSILHKEIAACLGLFEGEGLTFDEFRNSSRHSELASQMFEFFKLRGFIVPVELDEQEQTRLSLKLSDPQKGSGANPFELGVRTERYMNPAPVSLASFAARSTTNAPLKELKISIVGGCVVAVLKDRLEEIGLSHGFAIKAVVDSPDGVDIFKRVIERDNPDIIVYQPAVAHFLGPIWDQGAFISAEQRRDRLNHLKDSLSLYLERLGGLLQGRLGLVHNVSAPSLSPFGRSSFRLPLNFREIVSELNLHIESLIRDNPNLLLVDEDQIVSRWGASNVLDEEYFHLSHHGGIPDLSSAEFRQKPIFGEVFATEYLACHAAWNGARKIKCVVCDLDNTLWPGLAAEDGFNWTRRISNSTYLYFGIHEALRLVRQRGICLATTSKNNQEDTLERWGAAAKECRNILHPDEFVLHKINWDPKSKNIAEIAAALQMAPDALLFIDDNPVEREEVRQNLPGVRLLGERISEVRKALLTDPALDLNVWTKESMTRSEMLKSQLARDQAQAQAPDEGTFLKSLNIRLRISSRHEKEEMGRVIELIQRTNQFNTTLRRYDASTLESILSTTGSGLFTLSVEDRFCDYGLVGALVIHNREVTVMVMSCRVIGLKVAVPFLAGALRALNLPLKGFSGKIIEGPRNHPCRDIFQLAGFTPRGDGLYVLQEEASLAKVDSETYRTELK